MSGWHALAIAFFLGVGALAVWAIVITIREQRERIVEALDEWAKAPPPPVDRPDSLELLKGWHLGIGVALILLFFLGA